MSKRKPPGSSWELLERLYVCYRTISALIWVTHQSGTCERSLLMRQRTGFRAPSTLGSDAFLWFVASDHLLSFFVQFDLIVLRCLLKIRFLASARWRQAGCRLSIGLPGRSLQTFHWISAIANRFFSAVKELEAKFSLHLHLYSSPYFYLIN